jgi:formylmethanofuran dehydrogenase subunit E
MSQEDQRCEAVRRPPIQEMDMNNEYLNLDSCLATAKAFHGDVCAGIAIGTRMAIAGLKAIAIEDPKGKDRKNLIVFVEIDRCATDAIMAITGCRPGKRTMKIYDYGKMAATFINLETGKAVRLTVKETDKAKSGNGSENVNLADTYVALPEDELLRIEEVTVALGPEDLPGKPVRVVLCDHCGERVMDMREVEKDGRTLCRPCATGEKYYASRS